MSHDNETICEHGNARRSCEICERDAELIALHAEVDRLGEIVEWAIRELEAYGHISARNELRRKAKEGK